MDENDPRLMALATLSVECDQLVARIRAFDEANGKTRETANAITRIEEGSLWLAKLASGT